jgi:predicted aconitase
MEWAGNTAEIQERDNRGMGTDLIQSTPLEENNLDDLSKRLAALWDKYDTAVKLGIPHESLAEISRQIEAVRKAIESTDNVL